MAREKLNHFYLFLKMQYYYGVKNTVSVSQLVGRQMVLTGRPEFNLAFCEICRNLCPAPFTKLY